MTRWQIKLSDALAGLLILTEYIWLEFITQSAVRDIRHREKSLNLRRFAGGGMP
jgi:hypothetical protein